MTIADESEVGNDGDEFKETQKSNTQIRKNTEESNTEKKEFISGNRLIWITLN